MPDLAEASLGFFGRIERFFSHEAPPYGMTVEPIEDDGRVFVVLRVPFESGLSDFRLTNEMLEARLPSQENSLMICGICGHRGTTPGKTTITLERGDFLLVIRNVPAQICGNCGEAYVDAKTTAKLLEDANALEASGVKLEVRSFAA